MAHELHVDADDLRRHAGRVAMVGDSVALAADAARQVDLHSGAFGALCAFLPSVLTGTQTATRDLLLTTRTTVDGAEHQLRAMADSYDRTDDSVQGRLHALMAALP